MRYLYKIHAPYDGFYPSRIEERMEDGRFLRLGWGKYLDAVVRGDEVRVFFTGCRTPAVYIEGLVDTIDVQNQQVRLRVRRHSTRPLTDLVESAELRRAVAARGRQVFLWPSDRELRENCELEECRTRSCAQCDVWRSLPFVSSDHHRPTPDLRGNVVVPAYWAIPNRCFLYYDGRQPTPWVRRSTEMFAAFKVGEAAYAYPLALGMKQALDARDETEFDAVVPIPLSPEKAANGELDRTGALANGLVRMMDGARRFDALSLSGPVSKRRMVLQGWTPGEFKQRYRNLLEVDPAIANYERVLLVDDAITRGSTMSVALSAIRAAAPHVDIVVASAVQMIVKAAVADVNGPAW